MKNKITIEIERKFLVNGTFPKTNKMRIKQGYLQSEKTRSVRIRTNEKNSSKTAFLTIKGASNERGMSRHEFETNISVEDAEYLFSLCDKPLIEKTRYTIMYGGLFWEVDKFKGANHGLIVAEVELEHETQIFSKPNFIGKEITGDSRYYNVMLAKKAFSTWVKIAHDE